MANGQADPLLSLVSVILPVWNRAAWVARAVTSVLEQTHLSVEGGISHDLGQSLQARIHLFTTELTRTADAPERAILRRMLFNLAMHLALAVVRCRARLVPHAFPLTARRLALDGVRLVRLRKEVGVPLPALPFFMGVMLTTRTLELAGGLFAFVDPGWRQRHDRLQRRAAAI